MVESALQLRLEDGPQGTAVGGVVGADPRRCLAMLDGLGSRLAQVRLISLPKSRQDRSCGGLFFFMEGAEMPALSGVRALYRRKGRVFLPIDASLSAAVEDQELEQLLLYDYQLFHPALGLMGFDETDSFPPEDLLEMPRIESADWTLAQEGGPAVPRLRKVDLLLPETEDDIFQQGGSGIGSKSPSDAPEPKRKGKGAVGKLKTYLLGKFAEGVLEDEDKEERKREDPAGGGLAGQDGAGKSTGEGGGQGFASGASGKGFTDGILDRFQGWARQKAEELEDMRHKELNRLMDLLQNDPEKGLEYALPLGGPDAGRGVGAPSGRLQQRDIVFDPNRTGGEVPMDTWNVPEHMRWRLEQLYREAANREIALGDFDRAAYILGRLLGDYNGAANAFRQGAQYRKAAVLYRDRLNRKEAAAECLEQGGMLAEAVDLYRDLERHEKVGDLLDLLDQPDRAREAYVEAIEQARRRKDHVNAARVLRKKLDLTEEALAELNAGWPNSVQARQCVEGQLDLLRELNRHEESLATLEALLREHRSLNPLQLMEVLSNVATGYPEQRVRAKARDVARVVAGAAMAGDASSPQTRELLRQLPATEPHDVLLERDCTRMVDRLSNRQLPQPLRRYAEGLTPRRIGMLKMPSRLKWLRVFPWNEGVLVVGLEAETKTVQIQRMPLDGPESGRMQSIPGTPRACDVFACSSRGIVVIAPGRGAKTSGWLLQSRGSDWFARVEKLEGFPTHHNGATLTGSGNIAFLETSTESTFLSFYNLGGQRIASLPVKLDWSSARGRACLASAGQRTYFAQGRSFGAVSPGEQPWTVPLERPVERMALTDFAGRVLLGLGSESGVTLARPGSGGAFESESIWELDSFESPVVGFTRNAHLIAADRRAAVIAATDGGRRRAARFRESASSRPLEVVPLHSMQRFAILNSNDELEIYAFSPA